MLGKQLAVSTINIFLISSAITNLLNVYYILCRYVRHFVLVPVELVEECIS